MTDKENALETIRFGKPKRIMSEIPCFYLGYLGVNHQGYADTDTGDAHDRPVGSKWVDIWGTEWHKEYQGVMGFPKGNPLADTKCLNSYIWPDPNDERICNKIYQTAKGFVDKDEQFLCGSHRDTLWEKAYMLVGMENMMEYFYTEPEYAKNILHHIMDFQLGIAEHYEKVGIEIANLGDDMGTQRSLLFSPQIFDEFLLPEYQRLFDFYRQRNIMINFHSCGHIEPLLERFIKLGVTVLNPVQATANNLKNIIAVTQNKLVLSGGISTGLIIDGSYDEIRQTVKDTIELLGSHGGYFCTPDQHMPFPKDKIEIFYQALDEFGQLCSH